MRIIVDAFGGDNAPLAVLQGCEMAVKEYGVAILLNGNEKIIRKTAAENGISLEHMEISHTEDVIAVEDEPAQILKEHGDCSMAVGMKLLAQGQGDAFVSAGSTGALVMGSSLIVKRIKGIKRATLAPIIPSVKGCYILMDAGANLDCRPEMLVQFAVMGDIYMKKILGLKNPRVGSVNVGAEETKGLPLQIEAYRQLKETPVNFIGNVEPRDLPFGAADVVVTDGFTGNVILKLTEGMGSALGRQVKGIFTKNLMTKLSSLAVKKGINDFKKSMDYTEYGGAPLLGTAKPVIKAHGSSNGNAFKNAIRQAKQFSEEHLIEDIEAYLRQKKEKQE
ncbi:phosphate acyltransferase PlsX [Candidatus Soleaferrea massiliensis]|uniref:phosphate acyltransferase PlsX n=1 Tax=Candidatus Soleaferrea massiliensis TaxID=1470354 RepID=UPI00058D103B|nr:phosphate acyltransferase PlsX [Candidatus Soleaferrea massiliensis]